MEKLVKELVPFREVRFGKVSHAEMVKDKLIQLFGLHVERNSINGFRVH